MVSITVGSAMLHSPSAAGGLALSIVPSGSIDFERPEAAFVDVEIGRGQRLEGDARAGDAAGAAGIERARHLRVHLGEIDGHRASRARSTLTLTRSGLSSVAAVVVEEALGLVVAVRNLLDHGARRGFGLVPDLGDAGLDRVAAVARDQFAVAPRAELAGRDLRAQVAERSRPDSARCRG